MGVWDELDYADQPAILAQKKRVERQILITSIAPAIMQQIDKYVIETRQEVKVNAMQASQQLNHFAQQFHTSLKGEFGDKVQEEYRKKQQQLSKL